MIVSKVVLCRGLMRLGLPSHSGTLLSVVVVSATLSHSILTLYNVVMVHRAIWYSKIYAWLYNPVAICLNPLSSSGGKHIAQLFISITGLSMFWDFFITTHLIAPVRAAGISRHPLSECTRAMRSHLFFVGTCLGICGAINFNIRPIVRCTSRQHLPYRAYSSRCMVIRLRSVYVPLEPDASYGCFCMDTMASSLLTDHNQLYEFVIVCRIC